MSLNFSTSSPASTIDREHKLDPLGANDEQLDSDSDSAGYAKLEALIKA